ncbi:unnamed protein product [Eruca vesicaria subsp. sativa]|uniref:Uncharacterized protein n=1 Tax=Eruca vesicaria subsp. sativa TaxID=29727 RepID=A0ABC8J8Y2_ERUVS|nr:unnamed protein product [Eruca vesicaria subsp. sativa]
MSLWDEKPSRKEMKKLKEHYDMLYFVCDAQYRIPSSCPCRGRIVNEVSTYPKDKDWLPGRGYFTSNEFKDDGLHFRQPWVIRVQEEISRLSKKVDEMPAEIAELKAHSPISVCLVFSLL